MKRILLVACLLSLVSIPSQAIEASQRVIKLARGAMIATTSLAIAGAASNAIVGSMMWNTAANMRNETDQFLMNQAGGLQIGALVAQGGAIFSSAGGLTLAIRQFKDVGRVAIPLLWLSTFFPVIAAVTDGMAARSAGIVSGWDVDQKSRVDALATTSIVQATVAGIQTLLYVAYVGYLAHRVMQLMKQQWRPLVDTSSSDSVNL